MSELSAFGSVAAYLKDPLVLSGFVVFIGFLTLRQLLASGVIPILRQGQGFHLLRLALSYGFILGLAIILLGMGLKYRELSQQEQKRAAGLIANELQANVTVISELAKNTETLSKLGQGIALILRDKRLLILSELFPSQNIDVDFDEAKLTNVYIERIEWMERNKAWDDENERRRTEEACAAIVRFVDRTKSTVESLSDRQGLRYSISRSAYEANLDVVRKVSVIDLTKLAGLYYRMADIRVLYNRIVSGSLDYMQTIAAFCGSLPPTRSNLGPALALERLTFRLVPEYRKKIGELLKSILDQEELLRRAASLV